MNPLSLVKSLLKRGKTASGDSDETRTDTSVSSGRENEAEQPPPPPNVDAKRPEVIALKDDVLVHASENSTPRMSGLEIARDQEIQVLIMISRTGWLIASDVARLIWPGKAYGREMAYRLLNRLLKNEEILARPAPGCRLFVLSQRGVRRLRTQTLVKARTGKDLAAGYFHHRRLANAFVIENHIQADSEWPMYRTEYEIQSDKKKAYRLGRKVPDGILFDAHSIAWVECENARKKQADFNRLIDFTLDNFSRNVWMDDGLRLAEIYFVYEHENAKTRIVNELIRRYKLERQQSGNPRDWHDFAHKIIFVQIQFDKNRICTGLQYDGFQNALTLFDHGIIE